MTKAFGYIRTSSAANVGQDKDSQVRQRLAVEAYAKLHKIEIVDWYADEAVSGADAIEDRPGFAAMLDRIEGNGVRTVLVEDASRFARQMLVQELGVMALQQRGVKVFTATGDELTATDDPSKVMIRQLMAAFAQFEKARLVNKLAAARKRKREATGKCEGRKSIHETHPEATELARKLRRKLPKGGQMSLRDIAAELAKQGHLNANGRPYNPKTVAAMISR